MSIVFNTFFHNIYHVSERKKLNQSINEINQSIKCEIAWLVVSIVGKLSYHAGSI